MIWRVSNSLARHLLLIAVLTGCWACTSVTEFEETTRSVSMDPGVLTQELPNGFQYFLRSANGVHDSDRIEVRLLVKTGSLHERDDQLGYAHLLEHMAFRGTRSFSVEGIENLLDGVGLRWGADVNATTHYGATIYRFTLHQDDSELLPQLFSLMAEWLDSIEFDVAALTREKRIVEAEWRERYRARQYVVDPVTASAYSGSRYGLRPPVGDLESIRNATVESLEEFWHANYRPDNTALIVTGSRKPWMLEPLIQQAFAGLENQQSQRDAPNEFVVSKNNTQPGVLYYSDGNTVEFQSYKNPAALYPELSVNFVSAIPQGTDNELETPKVVYGRFKKQLLFNAYTHLLRNRLLKVPGCEDVIVETSVLESGQVVEHVKIRLLESDMLRCLAITYEAVSAVMNSALTLEEFHSMQQVFDEITSEIVSRYRNRNASELADNLADSVVNGELLLSVTDLQRLLQRLVKGFDQTELNRSIAGLATDHRVIYSLRSNLSEPVSFADMVAAVSDSSYQITRPEPARLVHGSVKPDQENFIVPALATGTLTANQASNERLVVKLAETERTHIWRLKNGATAVLLRDDRFDHFSMTAISSGGYAADNSESPASARLLPQFLAINGIDGYMSGSLREFKNRMQLFIEPFVHPLSHGLSATGSAPQLSSLLTLVKAYFGDPMVLQPQTDTYLRQLGARKPGIQWHDLYFKPELRHEKNGSVEVNSFVQAHKRLFGSSEKFGFIFVGSLDPDVLQTELGRFAASLPVDESAKAMVAKVNQADHRTTLLVNHDKDIADLAFVMSCNAFEHTSFRSGYWQLFSDIVATRLRVAIREESGLAYDLVSEPVVSKNLLQQIRLSVDPGDVTSATVILNEALEHLSAHKISELELRRAIKRRDRKLALQPGDYHRASILNAEQWLATGEVGLTESIVFDLDEINRLAQCVASEEPEQVVLNGSASLSADIEELGASDDSAYQK